MAMMILGSENVYHLILSIAMYWDLPMIYLTSWKKCLAKTK